MGATGRAVPAGAALGFGQLVDLDEAGALDPLEDQLGDPVAALQLAGRAPDRG